MVIDGHKNSVIFYARLFFIQSLSYNRLNSQITGIQNIKKNANSSTITSSSLIFFSWSRQCLKIIMSQIIISVHASNLNEKRTGAFVVLFEYSETSRFQFYLHFP